MIELFFQHDRHFDDYERRQEWAKDQLAGCKFVYADQVSIS
jgi:hypothetical protein